MWCAVVGASAAYLCVRLRGENSIGHPDKGGRANAVISPRKAGPITVQLDDLPAITHDIMLRAASGLPTSRMPVWAMRQAGRYLPEFRELRKTADFFTMCQTPALATEVTLQPLRRYKGLLDAVVIFSDILIIPQAMGLEVLMDPGRGPVFPAPLTSPEDMLARLCFEPDVRGKLQYLLDAITLTRRESAGIHAVPVIGFCGAPWTLMAYMIEGGGSKTFEKSKSWLLKYPEASHKLLSAIAKVCTELLVLQWQAGASILQVFESSGGELSPDRFNEFALPYIAEIAAGVRSRVPDVVDGGPPLIIFARGATHHALEALTATQYDVIGIDWTMDPADTVARLQRAGSKQALQGNLDPCELFGPADSISRSVVRMVQGFGSHPVIANLGHGMLPTHDPEALRCFFSSVHTSSAATRRNL